MCVEVCDITKRGKKIERNKQKEDKCIMTGKQEAGQDIYIHVLYDDDKYNNIYCIRTSFPSVIRLCVVINAFMTTTQLELVNLSPNMSTRVGIETCGLLVSVIKTK